MTDSLKFAFNPKGWKVKTEYRSNNRMKFQLKLDKQEAEAFRNFANTVKPENINMNDFVRSIFFNGVRSLEEELTKNMVKHIQENREEFEASGFTFDPEGNLTGVDESSTSGTLQEAE
tara:strand:+ start:544 stop:897 length:354 start_codon:yes stop_codon:yes gene_type:complete